MDPTQFSSQSNYNNQGSTGLPNSSYNASRSIFTEKSQNNPLAGSTINSPIPQAPALSLPKGGGSIQGMGEKFNVNSSNGTGAFSIPIHVSQTRSGFQPTLSLDYSSASGNSEFGLGWQLSGWTSISRKTSKGIPRYNDGGGSSDEDVFTFSGFEDLVPMFATDSAGQIQLTADGTPVIQEITSGGFRVRRYQPRIVAQVYRIERFANVGDPFDIHWRVITPQNVVTIFGDSDASRVQDPTGDNVLHPRIFAWLPSQSYDSHGNAIQFEYKREDSVNVDLTIACEANRDVKSRSANVYLKAMRYGNTAPNRNMKTWEPFSAQALPLDTWKFSIVLDYGEHHPTHPQPNDGGDWACRLDPFSSHNSGFEIRKYRMCKRLLLFHHFKELNVESYLVRSVDLTYEENPSLTYLSSIQQCGYVLPKNGGEPLRKALPAVQLNYSRLPTSAELNDIVVHEMLEPDLQNVPVGLQGTEYMWVDLDEEGLPGILTPQNGCWYYKRNYSPAGSNFSSSPTSSGSSDAPSTPTAQFGPLELISDHPSYSVTSPDMFFGDVNGAGRLDLIAASPTGWGYFERGDDDDNLGWKEFQAFNTTPNVPYPNLNVKLLDLTGDGLSDILAYGNESFVWLPSLGSRGFGAPSSILTGTDQNQGPQIQYADASQAIFTADMTGDGLADIMRIRNGECCYWPNLGYGKFGKRVSMDQAPYFDRDGEFRITQTRVVDMDGSGTADLLFFGPGWVDWYVNQAGNSFSPAKRLSFPHLDDQCSVNTVDLLGTGTTCLVWSSALPSAQAAPLRYVDIFRGRKPHLLESVNNSLGMVTTIRYASSAKFYIEDKMSGRPWITKLPFPVHVIEEVQTDDVVSGNRFAARYKYHHGFYDGQEREFRGFAKVEQWDTSEFAIFGQPNVTNNDPSWRSPPTRTVTWYHTGAYINHADIATQLAAEFFRPDASGIQSSDPSIIDPLGQSYIPIQLTDASEIREAFRVLKGHPIRVEIYAEDNTSVSGMPYSITETNFTVSAKQSVQDEWMHGIYRIDARETLNCSLERRPEDPLVQHNMVLASDGYGNPLKMFDVSYGRQSSFQILADVDLTPQSTIHVVYTELSYTNGIDDDSYRTPVVWEARVYELVGLEPAVNRFQLDDLTVNQYGLINALPNVPFEADVRSVASGRRLFKREQVRYRSNDLSTTLGSGVLQSLALPALKYDLAFTPGLLEQTLSSGGNHTTITNLSSSAELKQIMNQTAGYIDLENDGNWWRPSDQVKYTAGVQSTPATELVEARECFFTPKSHIDPFGNTSTATFDDYSMFAVSTTDAVQNTVSTEIDYRVLSSSQTTDQNGNRAAAAYDAIGMLVGTAILGKEADNLENSVDNFHADLSQDDIDEFFKSVTPETAITLLGTASTRAVYDISTPVGRHSPLRSATISREKHLANTANTEQARVQIQVAYTDGLGRQIQTLHLVDPGPLTDGAPVSQTRWACSGWTIYNNKGNPVKQYETFFTDSSRFVADTKAGFSPTFLYDPLGRLVGYVRQDHAIEKQVIQPWTHSTYDANDASLLSDPRTDPDIGALVALLPETDFLPSWSNAPSRASGRGLNAASKTARHANTPLVTYSDSMGRTFLSIEDNGSEKFATYTVFDIQGNVCETRNALGRIASKAQTNVCGDRIYVGSMDAGEQCSLPDVKGNILFKWTSRPCRFRFEHDAVHRPTRVWLEDDGRQEILFQEVIYGELAPQATDHNLRGAPWRVRDQSGQLTQEDFDFENNLLRSVRELATEYRQPLDLLQSVDLEENLVTQTSYDALHRPLRSIAPDSSSIDYRYGQACLVNQIFVNIRGEMPADSDPTSWTPIISAVEYNANGQETKITYANGVSTTRTYDPMLYRLENIRTSRSFGADIQNLTYTYDPVGNVTYLQDAAQQTIFFRGTRVEPSNDYTYDPTYRLIQATGREHLGQSNGKPSPPSPYGGSDLSRISHISPGDSNAMGLYAETYAYDRLGNLLSLSHAGSDPRNAGWTRRYTYNLPSVLEPNATGNRLSSTNDGAIRNYSYDKEGSLTSMPDLRMLQWDAKGQLVATSQQIVQNSNTPETTYYTYDWKGQRVRKVTESQTPIRRIKERIYAAGFEIFRKYDLASVSDEQLERTTLHLQSNKGRFATIENRVSGTDAGVEQLIRFQLTNLVGSSCIELTSNGGVLSYEEYFPFGATSYQATRNQVDVAKRYRFNGKELDDENGLYYYGARYYIPWLGRWSSCDPAGSGSTPYSYVNNNPILFRDPDGRDPVVAGGGWQPWKQFTPDQLPDPQKMRNYGSAQHFIVTTTIVTRLQAAGYLDSGAEGYAAISEAGKGKGQEDFYINFADGIPPEILQHHIYEVRFGWEDITDDHIHEKQKDVWHYIQHPLPETTGGATSVFT